MIKIIICDDHEVILSGFQIYFESLGDMEVLATCKNASKMHELVKEHSPDIVLMDVCTAENESGIDACIKIKKSFPDVKVIIMSGFEEISYIPRSKKAGADAFMYKNSSADEFNSMIRKVLSNKGGFPEPETIPVIKGEKSISQRELEVLRLFCKQKTRAEIAEELFISKHTVSHHIESVLRKTGSVNTLALVAKVIENQWISNIF